MASISEKINYVFDQICNSAGNTPQNRDKLRFEYTESSREEAKYFKKLKAIKTIDLAYNLTAAKYTDSDYTYVAFTIDHGINNDFIFPEQIEIIELDLPHFLYLSDEMRLTVKPDVSKKTIENELLWQQNDENYDGHSYSDIVSFFQSLTIIRFEGNNIIDSYNLERLCYYLLSHNKNFNPISDYNLYNLYQRIYVDLEKISHDNIFMSMTSLHRKHSFLEAYRCLEWIYILPRVLNLKDEINFQDAGFKLASSCVSNLAWRRKEEDSLSLLVKKAFDTNEAFKEKTYWMDVFKDVPIEKVAARTYLIRNQFVHQFTQEKEISISNQHCNELISFTLELLLILYKEYDNELMKININ